MAGRSLPRPASASLAISSTMFLLRVLRSCSSSTFSTRLTYLRRSAWLMDFLVVTPQGFQGGFSKLRTSAKPRKEAIWSHHRTADLQFTEFRAPRFRLKKRTYNVGNGMG